MAPIADNDTIQGFLAAMAAETPEPGGGAAAALMAATGAALLSMVCGLTIRRPQFAKGEADLIEVRREADDLRLQALALMAADAEAYRQVMVVRRLPRDSDAERTERTARIQEALQGATETPLRIAILATRVIELCGQTVDEVNPQAIGDLAVGALAARAALESAALSIRINLTFIQDAAFTSRIGEQLERAVTMAARSDEIRQAVEART